jgi:hypothetical protein
MSVRYFVLLLIGLALVSGVAMVRLVFALNGNGRYTAFLPIELPNHAREVKELPDLQNSSIIIAADEKANAGKGGGLAESPH